VVTAGKDVPFWIDEKSRVAGPGYVRLEDADNIEIDGVIVRRGSGGSGSFEGLGQAEGSAIR